MAAKSKRKGKSGERLVCKIFEQTFGGSWQRVFGSGAFVGGKNAFRKDFLSAGQVKNAKADIVPPDEMNIVIESKAYSDFPWHKLVQQDSIGELETWLTEIYTCIDEGDFWLLCVKIDYKGWFVMFDPVYQLEYGNHSRYYSKQYQKNYIITSPLEKFLVDNKEKIVKICQTTNNNNV